MTTMRVSRPPPMYIRASCVQLSQVQRPGWGCGYAPLRWPGGAVAEWLGRGLQSLVQRFESARRLFFPQSQPAPVHVT